MADRLRVAPGRIPRFIDEILRYDPPVHGLPRIALSDVEVAGVLIPKGTMVGLDMLIADLNGHLFLSGL